VYAERWTACRSADRIHGAGSSSDETIEARKEILIEQRDVLVAKINEMQKTLDLLNSKIEVYENALLEAEKEMIQTEDQALEI
jgi:MerR family transcriptional regulator, aldehyde-responsive regulator